MKASSTVDFSSRKAGYAIAVLGVLAAGPDAAYLRAQHDAGGSTAVISVWRYSLLAVCNLVLAVVFEGGLRTLLAGCRRSLGAVVGASVIIVFINAGMCISLLTVEPAFALLLMSLSPLWAALLGTLLLGDELPRHTLVAQALSLVSTLVVFVPSLRKILAPKHTPKHELWDPAELVPLATGFAVAVLLTYSRWQASASLEAAPAVGAALTAVAAAVTMLGVQEQPVAALVDARLAPSFWVALLLAAAGCALYDCALVLAPRALTSAEVALVLLAETILGPLAVWLAFGDKPGPWTLAGGALLLLTLIGHQIAGMRKGGDGHALFDAGAGAHRSPRLSPRLQRSPALDRGKRDASLTSLAEYLNYHTPLQVDVVERVRPGTYAPPRATDYAV